MRRPLALAVGAALICASGAGLRALQIGASRTALAVVVDVRGRPIVDLDADDFVVREAGRPREVLSVRVADYPIAIVLDNGRGAEPDFDAIRTAAARFIGRVGSRPVAVAALDPVRLVAGFDDDRAAVMDRLRQLRASASPEGLFEAVVLAARTIRELGAPFSAIVVVSAAPVSRVPPELLAPIVESGATVHVVVHAGQAAEAAAPEPSETLRALVDQTRGQFTPIFSAASYGAALDRLADRLAPELQVEYVVPVGSSSGDDVQLGVRIPGARVVGRGVR